MTPRRSPRRARRFLLTAALAAVPLLLLPACSGDDDANDTAGSAALDQVAPTKADVSHDAGVEFPASTADFRLVRIGADQVDVTFTLATTDVDAFASGSGIELTDGQRAITHASPLWDVAITGAVRGGSSSENGITRNVEVLAAGDRSSVRLSLVRG
jgi:hypothetical protein